MVIKQNNLNVLREKMSYMKTRLNGIAQEPGHSSLLTIGV